MSREHLLARISALGGENTYPVVPADLFFAGNDDDASFAPNLDPHPGIGTIAAVLRAIEDRPDVSAVLVQIDGRAERLPAGRAVLGLTDS